MNRLLSQPFVVPAQDTAFADEPWCGAGVFAAPLAEGTHALFAPLHYEPNYGYPLFVWLHGGGDNEQQLRRIMPLISLRNYAAVAPRGTIAVARESSSDNSTREGFHWSQSPERIAEAQDRVWAAIAEAQERFNIRADRIFLAGYQAGGTMALRLAVENASRFAGVISLGGPFPTQGAPLAQLNALRRLPLFVAACRQGKFYSTAQVCDNLRLLHSAGMSITLREYPGEDGLYPTMLADVDRWIMEQIAQPQALASATGSRAV